MKSFFILINLILVILLLQVLTEPQLVFVGEHVGTEREIELRRRLRGGRGGGSRGGSGVRGGRAGRRGGRSYSSSRGRNPGSRGKAGRRPSYSYRKSHGSGGGNNYKQGHTKKYGSDRYRYFTYYTPNYAYYGQNRYYNSQRYRRRTSKISTPPPNMPTYGSPFYRKEDSATYSRVWLASGGAASGAVLVGYHYQQYSYNYYYYDTTDYYSNPSYNSRQKITDPSSIKPPPMQLISFTSDSCAFHGCVALNETNTCLNTTLGTNSAYTELSDHCNYVCTYKLNRTTHCSSPFAEDKCSLENPCLCSCIVVQEFGVGEEEIPRTTAGLVFSWIAVILFMCCFCSCFLGICPYK